MKKLFLLIISICITVSLISCDNGIHERMLIRGVGIDYENEKFEVSVRVENAAEDKEELFSAKGETVYDALSNLSLYSGGRQMYADSYYIIFGENILSIGIENTIDFFIRYFKSLPTEDLYIAEGSAKDILGAKKDDKLISSEFIKELKNSEENSGKTVSVSLMEFLSLSMSPSRTALMPRLKIKDEKVNIESAAVFYDFDYKCELNAEEISYYLLAKGLTKTSALVIDNEDYGKITLEISSVKSDLDIKEAPDKFLLKMDIICFLASVTLGSPMEINGTDVMEKEAEEKIKRDTENLINKCYSEGADVLGINYKLYKDEYEVFSRIKDTDSIEKTYKTELNVKVNIIKTGEEDKPAV